MTAGHLPKDDLRRFLRTEAAEFWAEKSLIDQPAGSRVNRDNGRPSRSVLLIVRFPEDGGVHAHWAPHLLSAGRAVHRASTTYQRGVW
jgi:hypothetical protein